MLAEHNVVATLLPSAAFFLKLGRYAPARMLIEQGAAVALATDLNPGGGFTTSMPFVMSLGLLRHEHDARRGADRRHDERRGVDRSAGHDRQPRGGKQFDAVIVSGC
jgi:hypothetical protein